MDRFIVVHFAKGKRIVLSLKSSMDRFIGKQIKAEWKNL